MNSLAIILLVLLLPHSFLTSSSNLNLSGTTQRFLQSTSRIDEPDQLRPEPHSDQDEEENFLSTATYSLQNENSSNDPLNSTLPLHQESQAIKIKRQVNRSNYVALNDSTSRTTSGIIRPNPNIPPPDLAASTILNYNDMYEYVNNVDPAVAGESSRESSSDHDGGDGRMCRQQSYLPQKLFNLHSCAFCYFYMRDDNDTSMFGRPSRKWEKRTAVWKMDNTGNEYRVAVLGQKKNQTMTVFANVENPENELLSSFVSDLARQKWNDCCRAAQKCCEKIYTTRSSHMLKPGIISTTNDIIGADSGKCVATWDGWQCWNSTQSDTTAHALCPNYIYFVLREAPSCTVMAEKVCQANGTWFIKGRNEWTNYASCASAVIEMQKRRNYVHVMAYLVSIITIIPALVVFFAYKQLRVHRIILHQNFLFSMLINGLLVVAFKTIVILSELRVESHANSISNQNGIACRFLLILTKYSRMTNYMWMFCESFYLHRLIAAAFAEQKSLLLFYIIGWVFPIIPTAFYAGFRIAWANEKCWVEPVEYLEWILNVPSLLSLLFNMLFLVNIIRVLLTKLRANNASASEPSQYRKAVKATLILLPLFGLHFVVTIYRPSSASGTCEWTEVYYFINDILDGLQGFLVALIFCYFNGEVVLLFKRTYSRWREQRNNSGGGCLRQPSSGSRLQQARHSRGGSMLGRSIVSTQCYSMPASPEIITRLALTTTTTSSSGLNFNSNNGSHDSNKTSNPDSSTLAATAGTTTGNHKTLVNGGVDRSCKALASSAISSSSFNAGNMLNSSPTNNQFNNTIVQFKNNDPKNSWAEVKLNGQESNNCHELKSQNNVRLGQGSKVCNRINGEHQL